MAFVYYPKGVCSRKMTVELEDKTVKNIVIDGGCNGNIQAIIRLIIGMNVNDAISKIRGIKCGYKNTSCPDQLSIALELAAKAE